MVVELRIHPWEGAQTGHSSLRSTSTLSSVSGALMPCASRMPVVQPTTTSDPLVDALLALEERDARGRAHLAVRRRERQAEERAEDDDSRRAELDADAARRRDDRQLDADRLDDPVAVEAEADADADAAEREDPERVVLVVVASLLRHLARVVDRPDGHARAHRLRSGSRSRGLRVRRAVERRQRRPLKRGKGPPRRGEGPNP
eukprot:2118780-Prymnesium_polylepis.1